MKRLKIILISLLFLCIGYSTASALPVLAEYAVNIDGTVSYISLGDPVPAEVDDSLFDDGTGLGTITITITGPGEHDILGFFDHEIDEATNTFFNEYGEAVGAPETGQRHRFFSDSWTVQRGGS